MACNPWNSLPKDLLQNPEFHNIVKARLAMVQLRDALVAPTERIMKTFWEEKLKAEETCKRCSATNIKGVKGVVPPCPICQPRMYIIMGQAGKHAGVKAQINWSNSDPRMWNTHYWEVAKCYLGPGQKESSGPEATDCANIITLWLNCSVFANEANIELLGRVRDSRNKLMHHPDMKLSAIEMNAVIENIEALLKDEKLATNPDVNSQNVISELETIKNKTSAMFKELKGDLLDDLVKQKLRAELPDTYLTHYTKLKPLPWGDITLPISLVYQKQTLQAREDDGRMHDSFTDLKSIFEPTGTEQSRPRRILIQGPTGIGKSTLFQRLIQSWARWVNASPTEAASQHQAAPQDDFEDSRLHDFQLVFLIRVRELIDGDLIVNLQKNLVHSCWKEKDLEDRLKSCIDKNIEQVLLIVDGYDEGDDTQRTWVDNCLKGTEYRGCTLIVTSRPGFYRPTAQPEQNPDRTYTLMGLDRAKQQDFASKFDQVMGVDPGKRSASEQLSQFQGQDFLQTPLLLALVCVLARQGEDTLPKTVSALYNKFTEFLSCKAMRGPINFKEGEVTKLLKFLQEMALKLFNQNKSEISSELLNEHVLKTEIGKTMDNLCTLGLVQQEIKLKGLQNSQTGEFIHQSFLDFFAARHFVSLSEEERSALLEDISIWKNMLMLAAGLCMESEGLCGESEEQHRECFGQMLEAWDLKVEIQLEKREEKEKEEVQLEKREEEEKEEYDSEDLDVEFLLEKEKEEYDSEDLDVESQLEKEKEEYDFKDEMDHNADHACFLWLTELRDPCWLCADHFSAIYQTSDKASRGKGICLSSSLYCTASCYRGVTALLEAAQRHTLHGSHHTLHGSRHTLHGSRHTLHGSRDCTSSCCRGVTTLLEAARHTLFGSGHAPLDPATFKLTVNKVSSEAISAAAQLDLLDAALRCNVQLDCEELSFTHCLTRAEGDQLAAILPRLTQLLYLTIITSSLTALNAALRADNSTSRLEVLEVICSPSSPRDSPPATTAEDPWSPTDVDLLLDNISRFSALWKIALVDEESTVTEENRIAITQRIINRLPGLEVRFLHMDPQTGDYMLVTNQDGVYST